MRFVIRTAPGVLELAYMWLPTFIGHDAGLKKHIEEELAPLLQGKELTEDLLDAAHDRALDLICARYKALAGLRDYLDAVKFVNDKTG